MAQVTKLPCDSDGVCMVCKQKPPSDDTITCMTCITPWHLPCFLAGDGAPKTLFDVLQWDCPDCSPADDSGPAQVAGGGDSSDLIAAIRAIESDTSLAEQEKAKRRQELLGGSASEKLADAGEGSSNLARNNEVNREMTLVIESLQREVEEREQSAEESRKVDDGICVLNRQQDIDELEEM